MSNIVLLDRENIDKFKGLFLGDITKNFNSNTICYGALEENSEGNKIPVGLLMADIVKNELVITWLFVAPDYREQYIMTTMISIMINNLRNAKLVNSIYCATVNEEIAQYLLVQFGFYYDSFGQKGIVSSTVGNLLELSARPNDNNPSKRLVDIDEVILQKLNKYFVANQDVQVGVPIPIKPEDYLDVSMAIVENGEINAILLLNEDNEDLVVSYAYAKEGYGHLLMYIVMALHDELLKYPADKKIVCAALNSNSMKLFARLFENYTLDRLYECEFSM